MPEVWRDAGVCVTPATVHLIAQEIRFMRGTLTAKEKWVSSLPPSQATIDFARYIEFWRDFISEVEQPMIASGDVKTWAADRHANARARPR